MAAAPPPPPGRLTPADQTAAYLQHLHQNQTAPTPIYLHPQPISFYDHQAKIAWNPYIADSPSRDTYSTYTNANRSGAMHTVGFFQTWGGTWVGRPAGAWYQDDWHCWLGATARTPGQTGRTVLLWDSNAVTHAYDIAGERGRELIFNDLSAPQRRYVNDLRNAGPVRELWYGGQGNTGDRICTPLAAEQVRCWMRDGLPLEQQELERQGYWLIR